MIDEKIVRFNSRNKIDSYEKDGRIYFLSSSYTEPHPSQEYSIKMSSKHKKNVISERTLMDYILLRPGKVGIKTITYETPFGVSFIEHCITYEDIDLIDKFPLPMNFLVSNRISDVFIDKNGIASFDVSELEVPGRIHKR